MPMIPEEEIERVKREIDLGAVIRARGVELKAQGGDLVGRCPFHDDHDPSLRVTPGKGLWRCMSAACGATGNVIQFVQKFDGVSFRHAYELLKNGAGFTGAPTCAPVKKTTVPKLPPPVQPDADDQAALRQVLDYYHERLRTNENPAALAYLKKRGIGAEAIEAFRIGFVDRTLGLRLPQANRKEGAAIRERLQRLGILRETGHEHLRGRVVFPVIAEGGAIGTVYGRAIDDGGKHDRHLFLPGPQRGIFNPAALRSPEVIVTEGIIDALTFWCAGFRHVTTGYSAKALPEELLDALLAAKVSRVFIAFDRDLAGDKGAAEVAAQLAERGVDCLRVLFPHGQDANAYALAVTPAEKSLGVLLRAAPLLEGKGSALAAPGRGSAPAPVDASTLRVPASSLAAKAASEAAPVAPEREGTPTPTAEPQRAAREEKPETVPSVIVAKNEGDEIVLALGDRTWTVRGLAKNTGFESLKVTLRLVCECPGGSPRWHLDQVDLCVARQRAAFIEAAAVETALRPELVKRDLGHVLRTLEAMQAERLKAPAQPKKDEPQVSAQEREGALALLRDPKLLDRILADFAACGVVGEETNKLVGYLAAVSRKLDNPLAVIVQSTSAAGKSALMEAVLAFVPPEERVKYSALTGQALYYLGGESNLKHKILAIVEEEGAEKASYALKLLQSEGELSIASTGKDPHTGRMVTQEYRVEGPVMIFLTTTAVDIDEELLNRCLVLTVDESREQTRRIHAQQRARYTLDGIRASESKAAVLALHRAAQRLLRPLRVFNPYADRLTFLDDKTRTRRDHTKYLQLIATVAVLHQHQREIRAIDCGGGKRAECVVATLDDIAAANALAHETLGRCLDEMPPQTRRLLALIEREVAARCTAAKMERGDVRFTRRQVREATGWSNTQLHVHLARLVELEYLLTHRAEYGQGFVYELVYDGSGKDGARFVSGLLDVERLRRTGSDGAQSDAVASVGAGTSPCDYDEKRSGSAEAFSGSIRAAFGPSSGVFPDSRNGGSSSETSVPDAAARENARPQSGENAAA
ncbi:MAG: DNA primase [Verrucomicrobia bacterium ADurb.Bin122]|jgi:DNA primase catalytic core|nr:MAG: DNA primase [Verrucomicrobia bacterium ADurb.Bin122]HOY55554.1 DNA primase [Opitutaceae bacterium]